MERTIQCSVLWICVNEEYSDSLKRLCSLAGLPEGRKSPRVSSSNCLMGEDSVQCGESHSLFSWTWIYITGCRNKIRNKYLWRTSDQASIDILSIEMRKDWSQKGKDCLVKYTVDQEA